MPRVGISTVCLPPDPSKAWGPILQEAVPRGLEGFFVDASDAQNLAAIAAVTQAAGLRICASACTLQLTDGQAIAKTLNGINAMLDTLSAIQCEILVVSEPVHLSREGFAGRVHEAGARSLRDDEWQNLADGLNELGARCHTRGIKLAFRPALGSFVETPTEVKRLLNLTDAHLVGLCLDVAACVYGGGNPAEAISTYRWRLKLLQLQDINTTVLDAALRQGLTPSLAEARGVFGPPGQGQIDWSRVFNAVAEADESMWLVLEKHSAPHGPIDALERLLSLRAPA